MDKGLVVNDTLVDIARNHWRNIRKCKKCYFIQLARRWGLIKD